jgi:two-component system chemotaxis response regulator CheY
MINVMVVEDEEQIRNILKKMIEKNTECCVVSACGTFASAISGFVRLRPDVVFMDIIMPRITGIEALKQIIEFDPDAKVVMASSVGTQGHLKEALRAGAADFLQKPISDEDTRAILENAAKGVL